MEPDEELCIYHRPNLWFQPVGASQDERAYTDTSPVVEDRWGGLSTVIGQVAETSNHVPSKSPDPNEIVPDEDLPFTRIKLTSDEDDEETLEAVRTGEPTLRVPTRLSDAQCKVQAWAVDIPDPRHTTTAVKYIFPLPSSLYPSPHH